MIILFPFQKHLNLKTLTLTESGVLYVADGINTVVVISIQKTQLHLKDEEETLSSWGEQSFYWILCKEKKHITQLHDLIVRTERKKRAARELGTPGLRENLSRSASPCPWSFYLWCWQVVCLAPGRSENPSYRGEGKNTNSWHDNVTSMTHDLTSSGYRNKETDSWYYICCLQFLLSLLLIYKWLSEIFSYGKKPTTNDYNSRMANKNKGIIKDHGKNVITTCSK